MNIYLVLIPGRDSITVEADSKFCAEAVAEMITELDARPAWRVIKLASSV